MFAPAKMVGPKPDKAQRSAVGWWAREWRRWPDELQRRGQTTTPEATALLSESDRPAFRALLDDLARAGEIEAVGDRPLCRRVARCE